MRGNRNKLRSHMSGARGRLKATGHTMSEAPNYWILPYSRAADHRGLKLALELSCIAPGTGGVLISGQRGVAKSTAVRAFCMMMNDGGELPVTLPINATDDRVVGGWQLRPQLLDRFGLMVEVTGEGGVEDRQKILQSVLLLDEAPYSGKPSPWLDEGRDLDHDRQDELKAAQDRLHDISVKGITQLCAEIAASPQAPGHRGEAVRVLAARALAALDPSRTAATPEDVGLVAQFPLQHRRTGTGAGAQIRWDEGDRKLVDQLVRNAQSAWQADMGADADVDATAGVEPGKEAWG